MASIEEVAPHLRSMEWRMRCVVGIGSEKSLVMLEVLDLPKCYRSKNYLSVLKCGQKLEATVFATKHW